LWPAGALTAAEPPLDDFPVGGALSKNVDQMKVRVTYWRDAIRDAKTDANVLYARDRLVKDYKDMEAKEAGYTFAEHAATIITPLLQTGLEKDPLRTAKEVNLAAALSQMPQVSIQPALDVMVAHRGDPAVRYFGWKGYRAARLRIFAQGATATNTALTALEKAAKAETSAAVLEQIFRMLEIDAAKPSAVSSQEVWDTIRKRSWAALSANWKTWCERVLAGDDEMADAAVYAAAAAASHASWVVQDKNMKKDLLQMLVDLPFCAARAFVQARTNAKPGDRLATLLVRCEAALNVAANPAGKKFIENAVRDPRCNANPGMALLFVDPKSRETWGVLAWVDFLKNEGVAEPKFQPLAPTSAQTTRPATKPAGAP
jgi:hypothetical protein